MFRMRHANTPEDAKHAMSHIRMIAMIAAAVSFLSLGACENQGASLTEQWRAECAAEGFGSRTTGLAACIAKRRANYEAESLSGPANL